MARTYKVGTRVIFAPPNDYSVSEHAKTLIGQIGTVTLVRQSGVMRVKLDSGLDIYASYPALIVLGKSILRHLSLSKSQKKPSRTAKVFTKKVLHEQSNGDLIKFREITGFENVIMFDELPEKYRQGFPRFSMMHSLVIIGVRVGDKPKWQHLKVGQELPETDYQEIIAIMKAAGERLTAINKEAKELAKMDEETRKKDEAKKALIAEWSGEDTTEI